MYAMRFPVVLKRLSVGRVLGEQTEQGASQQIRI